MSAGDKAWDLHIKSWGCEPRSAQSFWECIQDRLFFLRKEESGKKSILLLHLENINEKIAKETFNKNKGKGPVLSDKIWYDWHLTDDIIKDIKTATPEHGYKKLINSINYKRGFSISKEFKIDGFLWNVCIYPAGAESAYEQKEDFYKAGVKIRVGLKDERYWKQSFKNDISKMSFEMDIRLFYSKDNVSKSYSDQSSDILLSNNFEIRFGQVSETRDNNVLDYFCHVQLATIRCRAELVSIKYKGTLVTDKTEIDKIVHKYKRGVEEVVKEELDEVKEELDEVKEELDEVTNRLRKQKQENELLKKQLAEFEMKKKLAESNDEHPIREWLTSVVKLPQYVDTFIEGGFDMESMVDVTMDDLKELKIDKLGHRKKKK
eukprot:427072_1